MIDILFWFFYLFTPITTWFLLRVAGERINQVSLLNLTTIAIYVFSVLGLLPLYYQWDRYRYATGVTNPDKVVLVLLCSFTAIVFFLLGAIFIRKVAGMRPLPMASNQIQYLNRENVLGLFLAFGLVAAVLLLYLSKVKGVALFVALREGAAAATVARSEMTNNFPKYHRYSLIMRDLGMLVTLAFFGLWLLRKTFSKLILFLMSFIVSAFAAVMTTEKMPFISLVFGLFMVFFIVRRDGFAPKRALVMLGFATVCVLAVFYMSFMGSSSAWSAIKSLFSRAFSGSISPAYFYLEYVPNVRDFYWFKTFPNPGNILPFAPERYTVDIMNWRFPTHVQQGIVGSMPTVFWGEAYLNFGYPGIPIIAFIMGVYVSFFDYMVTRLQLNPVSIAFYVWLILHIKDLGIGGFSGMLYDFYIVFLGFFVLLILSSDAKLRLRYRRRLNDLV